MSLPAYKPRPDSGIVLEPYQPDPGFTQAMNEYLDQFTYKIHLRLGPTYSKEFRDFTEWCQERLGQKYKDWFLYSAGKDHYVLFMRNSKWGTFLALTWVDNIV